MPASRILLTARIIAVGLFACTLTVVALPAAATHKPDHDTSQGQGNQGQGNQGQGNQGQGNQGQGNQGQGNQGQGNQGQGNQGQGNQGQGNQGQGNGSGTTAPPDGDPSPTPEVRVVEPDTTFPPTEPVTIELAEEETRLRVHVSPPGEIRRVYARIRTRIIELKSDGETTLAAALPASLVTADTPFTITAEFGSTTASVKGILRPRVAGATDSGASDLLPSLNAVYRSVHGQNPTFAAWEHWAQRILAREKTSVPDLFGAIQWQARFGER